MRHSEDRSTDDAVLVLRSVARHLRTGSSITTAVEQVLHEHPDALPGVVESLAQGSTVTAALTGAAVHPSSIPEADRAVLVQSLMVASTAGPAAAATVERAAGVLAERHAWQHERRSAAAQAVLSARVLTALPVVTGLWALLGSERVRAAVQSSPLPLVAVTLGIGLDALGWWWMRRLVADPATARSWQVPRRRR